MQPPTPDQPPQPQPPQQRPAWALYDIENKHAPIPETWVERQMAVYRHDVQRWARRLSLPVPAVWALLAVLLVGSCSCWGVAGIVTLANPNTSPSSANASPTATATSAPIVSAAPTVTPGPSPTPFPTATFAPTPTPPIVLRVSGNGDKSTQVFTVIDTWEVTWKCSGDGLFYINFYNAADNSIADDEVGYTCPPGGGGDSSIFHDSGTFYLQTNTGISWTITIIDLPN